MNDRSSEQANGPFENRPQPLYVTLILDETGSMQDCKARDRRLQPLLATLRQEPAETRVTLTLFNSKKTEVRYQAAPVAVSTIWTSKPIGPMIRLRSMMRSGVRLPPPGRKCLSGSDGCVSF